MIRTGYRLSGAGGGPVVCVVTAGVIGDTEIAVAAEEAGHKHAYSDPARLLVFKQT